MPKSGKSVETWKCGTSAGFAKLLFIMMLSVTVFKAVRVKESSRNGCIAVEIGFSVYIGLNVSEGRNVGGWCDVRHTMCDARHISVCSVTFVTASVAVVTGTTPVSSLGWAWLLLFGPFHSFLHLLFFLFYLCFK